MLISVSGNVHSNPGPYHDLSLCHTNVRSLRAENRMTHIQYHLAPYNAIITVSETSLTNNDQNENYTLIDYQEPFRRDRLTGAQGYGGVLAWVKNTIACKRRPDFKCQEIESMWLEIRSQNNKFFLCVIYRAESNTDNSFLDILHEQIDLVMQQTKPNIIITGDLNADPLTRHGNLLDQFCVINDLVLLVEESTRITPNSATILDQFITNMAQSVKCVKVLPPVSQNDHCTIIMECLFRVTSGHAFERIMWNYDKSNLNTYCDNLKTKKI